MTEGIEIVNCVVAAGLLLEELIESFEERALVAIAGATRQRMEEAQDAKAAGKADWWKVRPSTDEETLWFGSEHF